MNLVSEGWGDELERADTLGYYKYVKKNVSFGENVRSDVILDILIPVLEKDLPVLRYCLSGIRKFLRHPINNIFIVAPESQKIRDFCKKENCAFVLENDVLPLHKYEIDYVCDGKDRSGWLFQQLLKLSGDAICSQDYFLVVDADTVFRTPQIFIVDNKMVLLHSEEHHHPYFEMYWKLLGNKTPTNLSFVSHQMLFNCSQLAEMRHAIEERHHKKWYNAILSLIDRNQQSGFSEYETYGQWILQNYPESVIREYWFNLSLPRKKLRFFLLLGFIYRRFYKSMSFHSWQS